MKQRTLLSKFLFSLGEVAEKLHLYRAYLWLMAESVKHDPEGKVWLEVTSEEDIDKLLK